MNPLSRGVVGPPLERASEIQRETVLSSRFHRSLAYLDPGNLESDLQMGAYTRYTLVWVLFWSTLGGLLLQEMSARLGVVTGQTLAQCAKAEYGPRTRFLLYAAIEVAIVGSDIQEVLGTAIGLQVLFGLPLWAGCVVTGIDTASFFLLQKLGWRALEACVGSMVAILVFCFVAAWAEAPSEPDVLLRGLAVPTMRPYMLTQAVATVGAMIMPHNLYLHSGLVRSRRVDRSKRHKVRDAIVYNLCDAGLALLVSFVANLAVVATFAAFFWSAACAKHGTACVPASAADGAGGEACSSRALGTSGVCSSIGLAAAAPALKAAVGPVGVALWGTGLVAAGQASTMAATLAGQFVMEGFWDLNLPKWQRVAVTRAVALGPAVVVAVSTASNSALQNAINELLNVLQSAMLPFAMLPLVHLTNNRQLMGPFRNSTTLRRVVTAAALFVLAINLVLVYQYACGDPHSAAYYAGLALATGLYFYAASLTAPTLFKDEDDPPPDPEGAPDALEPKHAAKVADDDFLRREIQLRAAGLVPMFGIATPESPTDKVCCCGKNPNATPLVSFSPRNSPTGSADL